MTRSAYKRPDTLLDELGITEPGEIIIEAIAQACGATVVYEPIGGADARILGAGDQAIITVDSRSPRPRQRFSAAHELGHWLRDRGRIAFSCEGRVLLAKWGDEDDPEKRANRYAADLLLPRKLVSPRARGIEPTFEGVRTLADAFETSLTATAIRLVELGSHPAMLVCSNQQGRQWCFRSALVPTELRPVRQPGAGAMATALLAGAVTAPGPTTVDADDWIEHEDAKNYCVVEDSVRSGDSILSMIWWKDESQIVDLQGED